MMKKAVLGIWLGKPESARFWMGLLTDRKARGVEDILITAKDNLHGFTQPFQGLKHRYVWRTRLGTTVKTW